MSLLENLSPNKGSVKNSKRVGRGDGSGWGGTSGKGHKGQKARSGGTVRRGFEGGQTPLWRRLPKIGFTNNQFKTAFRVIGLGHLEKMGSDVNPEVLLEQGVMSRGESLKVLANGTLSKAINVSAHKVSAAAKEAIEKAGGKVTIIESVKLAGRRIKTAQKKGSQKSKTQKNSAGNTAEV